LRTSTGGPSRLNIEGAGVTSAHATEAKTRAGGCDRLAEEDPMLFVVRGES
jgi:hypothetical protein